MQIEKNGGALDLWFVRLEIVQKGKIGCLEATKHIYFHSMYMEKMTKSGRYKVGLLWEDFSKYELKLVVVVEIWLFLRSRVDTFCSG